MFCGQEMNISNNEIGFNEPWDDNKAAQQINYETYFRFQLQGSVWQWVLTHR